MHDGMIENPMVIGNDKRSYYRRPPREHIYRPEPRCCCGCKREIVDGWEWEGDYFFDDGCIVRYMKENVLKAIEF